MMTRSRRRREDLKSKDDISLRIREPSKRCFNTDEKKSWQHPEIVPQNVTSSSSQSHSLVVNGPFHQEIFNSYKIEYNCVVKEICGEKKNRFKFSLTPNKGHLSSGPSAVGDVIENISIKYSKSSERFSPQSKPSFSSDNLDNDRCCPPPRKKRKQWEEGGEFILDPNTRTWRRMNEVLEKAIPPSPRLVLPGAHQSLDSKESIPSKTKLKNIPSNSITQKNDSTHKVTSSTKVHPSHCGSSLEPVVSSAASLGKIYKKDPNGPKKFKTAYIFFCMAKKKLATKHLQQTNESSHSYSTKSSSNKPRVNPHEVTRHLAEMWRNLGEVKRAKYEEYARLDKIRYINELKAYESTLPSSSSETKESTKRKHDNQGKKKVKKRREKGRFSLNPDLPTRPKKPASAFFRYSSEKRPIIRNHYPHYKFGDISKLLSKMWSKEKKSVKESFIKEAQMEHEEYKKKVLVWGNKGKEEEEEHEESLEEQEQKQQDRAYVEEKEVDFLMDEGDENVLFDLVELEIDSEIQPNEENVMKMDQFDTNSKENDEQQAVEHNPNITKKERSDEVLNSSNINKTVTEHPPPVPMLTPEKEKRKKHKVVAYDSSRNSAAFSLPPKNLTHRVKKAKEHCDNHDAPSTPRRGCHETKSSEYHMNYDDKYYSNQLKTENNDTASSCSFVDNVPDLIEEIPSPMPYNYDCHKSNESCFFQPYPLFNGFTHENTYNPHLRCKNDIIMTSPPMYAPPRNVGAVEVTPSTYRATAAMPKTPITTTPCAKFNNLYEYKPLCFDDMTSRTPFSSHSNNNNNGTTTATDTSLFPTVAVTPSNETFKKNSHEASYRPFCMEEHVGKIVLDCFQQEELPIKKVKSEDGGKGVEEEEEKISYCDMSRMLKDLFP